MAERLAVRERISPGITASLFANYRSSADAIQELVDNALDSRLRGVPMRIDISTQRGSITVSSIGGAGMGPEEFSRDYLHWGASPKRGQRKLGRYGQGGKAAIGFLGSRFSIEASRPNEAGAWRIADADYRRRERLKTYDVDSVPRREAAGTGYVRVRIDGVDKRIDERRLAARLVETYRPLIEAGDLTLTLNGRSLTAPEWNVEERRDFRVRAGGTILSGWYGTRAEPAPDAGMRCYRLGRLITSGEFFGHPLPAQAPGMGRLVGEVEVPVVALTMNKSDFDRDSGAWVDVEARMHQLLRPLARRLARPATQRPSPGALRAAEQARRLLSQALKLIESGDLFPGFESGKAPDGNKQPAGDELPLEPVEAREKSPAGPRVAAPAAGSAARRRRGFGDIVVRPLDPHIRSQSILENGVRKIVINSNYPLFVERKGDKWYQLETAAREICFLAEPADARDFDRRLNEILLMAFRLGDRKPRRGAAGRQLPLLG